MPDWSKETRAVIARLNIEPAREAALVEELSQHLTDRYHELTADGVEEAEACRLLREELNDGNLIAELRPIILSNPERIAPGLDQQERLLAGLGRDLRFAVRLLRLNPGFAAVAILSLALGIGANTAIFELLDAVLLRTLSVPAPQQLADIQEIHRGRLGNTVARQREFSFAIWEQLRQQQKAFSGIAAWSTERFDLGKRGRGALCRRAVGKRQFLPCPSGSADPRSADFRRATTFAVAVCEARSSAMHSGNESLADVRMPLGENFPSMAVRLRSSA